MAIYTLEKGAHIPKHSHPQQQTTYIRSGKVKIIINGNEERILKAGDVIVIPGNISHEFFVLEKTEDIDVFSPKREPDWILGKSK
ncbi:cupin domain-containing protein [Tenacibaculum ovolyticum]|uniref:cupin domain-containing protein n=1 Tax=Tenacibaculum ovolyticum TaxID=104270 RepID=UPI0007EC9BFB|nr:cupin domain-containing protein [Tenacibaculum ovolyticum]